MTKDELIKFFNDHPASFMATIDGDQPRVRGMGLYKADEKGLVYQTWDDKDIWNQILKNPKLEISFNDLQAFTQVRVDGIAEILDDQNLKEEIVAKRPFLKPVVEKRGYGPVKVFRVTRCKVCIWTMATNFAPKEWIEL